MEIRTLTPAVRKAGTSASSFLLRGPLTRILGDARAVRCLSTRVFCFYEVIGLSGDGQWKPEGLPQDAGFSEQIVEANSKITYTRQALLNDISGLQRLHTPRSQTMA
jgi:hypothetical protein